MKQALAAGRLWLLPALVLLFACQKNETVLEEQAPATNAAAKVTAWLDSRASLANTPENKARIEALKSNLLLTNLTVEVYKEGSKLLVIPISPLLKLRNNKNGQAVDNLVVVLDPAGNISKSNVVHYAPESDQVERLPANTFSKLFTYQTIGFSGTFTVANLYDQLVYELNFAEGKLKSVAEPRPKTGNGSERTNGCIDWYLVTTYYYPDGSTHTEQEYLYRSCDGCDPNQPQACPESLDPDGNGGGGGSIEYEYAASKIYPWRVDDASSGMSYFVMSQERVKYKITGGTGGNGYFTDAKHLGSAVMEPTIFGWTEISDQTSHTSDQVKAKVKGKVLQQAGDPILIEKETTFNY